MMQNAAFAEPGADYGSVRTLLELEQLRVRFEGEVDILRGVSLQVQPGEIVALVGESGCGKTLTALAILGLLPAGASIVGGRIELAGEGDLLALGDKRRREIRARRVSMIFQEPMSALNPVLTLGFQIGECLRATRRMPRAEARAKARSLLESVSMPDPERRLQSYPHQLSGGQLQRAMIAMALASGPDLLLADEPTTALDVTVQAQVIDLLLDLRRRLGLAVLLITHDLGVVAQCADRVTVMYCGQVIETASVEALFARPAHPYTRALIRAVPRLHQGATAGNAEFDGIPGQVPEPGQMPAGCAFHPRCDSATDLCRDRVPELLAVKEDGVPAADGVEQADHQVRCFLHANEEQGQSLPGA